MSNETDLANALERLSRDLAAQPISIVGMQVTAQGGAQGGTVVGMYVDMSNAKPNAKGDVIGLQVTASYDGTNPNAALIGELLEAAASLRKGQVSKGWIKSLLDRVGQLGMAALSASAAAATKLYLGLP